MSECLTDQQLEELAAGALDDVQAEPLWAHVSDCPDCRAALDECRDNQAFAHRFARVLPRAVGTRRSRISASLPVKPQLLDAGGGPLATDSIPGYDIVREIHRGGQGVVYEAIQRSTQRTVAVKVLLEGPFASERARWRFEREVRLVAGLKHPNIVVVHDSGVAQGRHYFAMDYVRGQPLDEYVRGHAMSVREVVKLFICISEAVAYAHRRGVMHRDLKPSNILVTEEGTPLVLDFGLAKGADEEAEDSAGGLISLAGHLMGTLRYMSPEQTAGKPDAVDIRTDVYSLGVIFYELLIDAPPYETTRADLTTAVRNIREADPPRPSKIRREVGSELEAIALKSLEKEPSRRYQSAGEFAADLQAWLDGLPVTAKSASSLYVIRKLAFRHGAQTLLVASVAIIIVATSTIAIQAMVHRDDAISERDRSRKAVAEMRDQRDTAQNFQPWIPPALGESVFGWLLMEWHAGRQEEARALLARFRIPSTEFPSPEHRCATFLLDASDTPESLLADVPPHAAALAGFVIGERELRAGHLEAAIAAYQQAWQQARSGQDPLMKRDTLVESFAAARLRRLGVNVEAETLQAAHQRRPDTGE
jgi:serine/threonine protein kinase